jgi:hypothetical protein
MNYKDAWEELKDGFYKAEYDVYKMATNAQDEKERARLMGKVEGIRLAEGHIKDIEASIDQE